MQYILLQSQVLQWYIPDRNRHDGKSYRLPLYKADEIASWDDTTFLNKAKITIRGKITNTAIVLLGREESEHLISPAVAKITELIQQLRLYPQAVVILDYTLFDFAGADELIVLQERFKEADWILFSDELKYQLIAAG